MANTLKPPAAAQGEPDRGWLVSLAERAEDEEWRLVGEPVPDARFDCMATAHPYAENRNRRDFGKGFDWLADPPRAWLVVAESGLGERVLKLNRPMSHGEQ